jgi:hypothetical protein
MPNDPKKRQKRLERQKAKRKEKRHIHVREQSGGLPERLSAATHFPVLHCWIGDSIAEEGIGWVVLSRAFPNGLVAAASFLVDTYCLGVKDVHAEVIPRADYDIRYLRKMTTQMPSRMVAPAEARKLLQDAVAYAHDIGLSPHPDYAKVMLLFGDVNAADSNAAFEFGKDGKPFFVSGPRDTPARCKQIMAILMNTCGQGHFDFLIQVDPDALGRGDVRILGPAEGEDEDTDELEDSGGERRW